MDKIISLHPFSHNPQGIVSSRSNTSISEKEQQILPQGLFNIGAYLESNEYAEEVHELFFT